METMMRDDNDNASDSSTGGLADAHILHHPESSDDDLSLMSDDDDGNDTKFAGGRSIKTKTTAKASSITSALSGNHPLYPSTSSTEGDHHHHHHAQTTIKHKLKISNLGMFGREKELGILRSCLDKVVAKQVERQLILISGVSGTGKSSLANSLIDPVMNQENAKGLFVRGKFDLRSNEPYAGIASACAEICGHILALQLQDPARYEHVCHRIQDELGPELLLLNQVISVLGEIVDPPNEEVSVLAAAVAGAASSAEAKNRFQFAFQRFIRIISNEFSPFVMVLDDLHWADMASLQLLDAFVSDRANSSIIVIGIYRSNEVDETTQAFHDVMEEFQFKIHDNVFDMTEMFIDDLDLTAVHEIIQKMLSVEDDDDEEEEGEEEDKEADKEEEEENQEADKAEVDKAEEDVEKEKDNSKSLGLAKVCLEKTHGNAFFLVHFLSMLHENGLLRYNAETLSWDWDEQEIENNTKASANVVEMLKSKMKAQRTCNIEILKVAACLGCTFEEHILRMVYQAMTAPKEEPPSSSGDEQGPKNTITAGLKSLEQEGYIRKHSESSNASYAWSHDKIQEAALALISDRQAFSRRVGEIMLSGLDEEELESAIFVVANLLNSGGNDKTNAIDSDDGKAKKLKLAKINRDASCKAVALSAFDSAAEYAGHGIQLLNPQTKWTDEHYALTMELYSIGAQAEGYLGHVEKMEKYCQEVLAQEDRPLKDKLSVYHTWIDSVSNRGKTAGAAELLLHILGKFDCRFPRGTIRVTFGILSNLVRVKTNAKSLQSVEHDEMTDTTKTELMRLLDKLATCLYMEKDDRMPLVVFRSLNWTNTYGFCDQSPVSYATAGMMLTGILNDIQGGAMYGEKALELLEKAQSPACASRTIFIVNNFLFTWTKPMRELVQPLLHAYELGLQLGDSESALWASYASLQEAFISGSPLEQLATDFQTYCNQMKDLKRFQHLRTASYMRQALSNFMGRNEDGSVTELVGEFCTRKDLEEYKSDPFHLVTMSFWEGMLMTYFGEHVKHAKMAIDLGIDYMAKVQVAAPGIMFDTFLKGVSCFVAARETGHRKYARMGEKFRAKIKKWHSQGNPNVKHYELILDAEHYAVKGQKSQAIKNYEEAISAATKTGHQQDAALASERLSEFQLLVMRNEEEAALWITESVDLWRSWGAAAKVDSLENKYSQLLPQPAEIVTIASSTDNTKTDTINTSRRGLSVA